MQLLGFCPFFLGPSAAADDVLDQICDWLEGGEEGAREGGRSLRERTAAHLPRNKKQSPVAAPKPASALRNRTALVPLVLLSAH